MPRTSLITKGFLSLSPTRIATGMCFAALMMSSVSSTWSASVTQYSRDQMLASSDLVFVGTVQSSTADWTNANHVMISTIHTISIDRLISNDINGKSLGDTIDLRFAGGEVEGEAVKVPGVPELNVGDTAVFFVNGDNLLSISPVVGVYQGLFDVEVNASGQKVVAPFDSTGTNPSLNSTVGGQSLDAFLAGIEKELPLARQKKNELLASDAAPVQPVNVGHARFVPADPLQIRSEAQDLDIVSPALKPLEIPGPPAPAETKVTTSTGSIQPYHEPFPLLSQLATRFSFLWGPPAAMRTFNIPPNYGAWGTDVESSLARWNRYSDIHRIYASPENTYGHQGRNDFVFETAASINTVYGISLGSDVLGYAILYNSLGEAAQLGHIIYESDMVLISDKNWTLDYDQAYNGAGSLYYFAATAIHEFGHCFGREHSFTESTTAWWHSVMFYPPPGKMDTMYFAPFMDDAESIRRAYPDQTKSIDDCGFHMMFTDGGAQQWASFVDTAAPGDDVMVFNHLVENLGTSTQSPQIEWYLTPNNNNFSGISYYCGTTSISSLDQFQYWLGSSTISIPVTIPPGTYYIACRGASSDGNDENRNAWSDTPIVIASKADLKFETTGAYMTLKNTKGTITGNLTVTNAGGEASAACQLGVYLYASPYDFVFLRSFYIPALNPGSTTTIEPGIEYKGKKYKPKPIKYKFHKGFADGKSILFCIDDVNSVEESDESNNVHLTAPMYPI